MTFVKLRNCGNHSEREVKETNEKILDTQAGFRKGIGCTDQAFSLRGIADTFLTKG